MTTQQEIAKLNYRQVTLLAALIGLSAKTVMRYAKPDGKGENSRGSISVIESGWGIYKNQILKVK